MIVCVCKGVSERDVRQAIVCGARCLESLGAACRAGTECGACREELRDMLEEMKSHLSAAPTSQTSVSEAA